MKKRPVGTLVFASPWIFVTAVILLLAIILVFAVNNLRREERLAEESLLDRGKGIIRLLEAGTRASMMGMMGRMAPGGASMDNHLQHLSEQAAQEEEILYIAVVDPHGRIIIHSDPQLVGTTLPPFDSETLSSASSTTPGRSPLLIHGIKEGAGSPGRVFELSAPFTPFARHNGQFRPGRPSADTSGGMGPGWQNRYNPSIDSRRILVGLDMSDADAVLAANRRHIFFISLALLLVGIGGWLALLGAQGYRTAEKTLQFIQAFTGLLISRLPLGIIAVDHQGLLTTFNEVAAGLCGVEAGENILGRKPAEVLNPKITRYLDNPEETTEILDREIVLTGTAGGKEGRTVMFSAVPVRDEEGEIIGRVALLHDVTEVQAMERAARKNERLVALGKMAAGVAHEIRNPLSSIKGLATLLGSRFTGEENQREIEAARLLVSEVERVNRSVSELLDYARPLPLNRQAVSLHQLLRNSLQLVAGDAGDLGVELEFTPRGASPVLSVDPDRITQVMLNLYLNSLQAMPKGGRLRVEAMVEGDMGGDKVDGSGTTRGRNGGDGDKSGQGRVLIRVSDTGEGISPENLSRVTDPYFTTKPEGSGLGLALVQKIVEEHGGSMEIESREVFGATINITLYSDSR